MVLDDVVARKRLLSILTNRLCMDELDAIEHAVEKGYVTRIGETPKSLSYNITSEGRKYLAENRR